MLEMVKTNTFPEFALNVQEVNDILQGRNDNYSKAALQLLNEAEVEIFDALEISKTSREFTSWCDSDNAQNLKHRSAVLIMEFDETLPIIVKTALDEVYFLIARSIQFYSED